VYLAYTQFQFIDGLGCSAARQLERRLQLVGSQERSYSVPSENRHQHHSGTFTNESSPSLVGSQRQLVSQFLCYSAMRNQDSIIS
jgi:hypothetical protein